MLLIRYRCHLFTFRRQLSYSAIVGAFRTNADQSIIDRDTIRLTVRAGNGGIGLPRYDGVGGDGGSIYIVPRFDIDFRQVTRQLSDDHRIVADCGGNATKNKLIGLNGTNRVLKVPIGVEVVDAVTKLLLYRCEEPNKRYLIAQGGVGGKRSNNYIGQPGDRRLIGVHLKLRTNIGLVGFPNAGKSTLLKALVPSRSVKIASYPFTTIRPQIGHIWYEDEDEVPFSLSIADLPGLIEGAHANRGRGHAFLKHLEYAQILLMIIDLTGFQLKSMESPFRTALETIALLNRELELYDVSLLAKPIILCLNKIDLPNASEIADELMQTMRADNWHERVDDVDCRPTNPIRFEHIITMSARSGRIGSLAMMLRRVYDQLQKGTSTDDVNPFAFIDRNVTKELL